VAWAIRGDPAQHWATAPPFLAVRGLAGSSSSWRQAKGDGVGVCGGGVISRGRLAGRGRGRWWMAALARSEEEGSVDQWISGGRRASHG
jgi:hypothetical protein